MFTVHVNHFWRNIGFIVQKQASFTDYKLHTYLAIKLLESLQFIEPKWESDRGTFNAWLYEQKKMALKVRCLEGL